MLLCNAPMGASTERKKNVNKMMYHNILEILQPRNNSCMVIMHHRTKWTVIPPIGAVSEKKQHRFTLKAVASKMLCYSTSILWLPYHLKSDCESQLPGNIEIANLLLPALEKGIGFFCMCSRGFCCFFSNNFPEQNSREVQWEYFKYRYPVSFFIECSHCLCK